MEKTYIVTIRNSNIRCDELNNNQVKIDDSNLINKSTSFFTILIEKIIFPLTCLSYIILMLVGVVNPNHPLSLFMALFSLFLAMCYSDFVSKKLIKLLHLKIKKSDYKIWLLLYTVLFTLITFVICLYIRNKYNIPFINDGNVGNLLTWFSIIIFACDKTYQSD